MKVTTPLLLLLALLAGGARAQSDLSPKLTDFQAALDRANSATADSRIERNLPGYGGTAPDLQGRAGSDVASLQADGAVASAADPISPAIGGAVGYVRSHPVDENAAWVKGALGVANNPAPSTGGVEGTSQTACHTAAGSTGQTSLYTCESGNIIETRETTCESFRDIVSAPATRTCASDSYFDAFSTYENIASYTQAHICTLYAGPSGLNYYQGCGLLIGRISTKECAPPKQVSGNRYIEYCKAAYTTLPDVTYLGSRQYSCGDNVTNASCSRTSETCTAWTDQPNGICAAKTVIYTCGGASWVDHGLNEVACYPYSGDAACAETGKVCLQHAADVPEIMSALGLAPEACLRTKVSYACDSVTKSGSDCDLPASCTLKEQNCIDPDYNGTSPCRTFDYVYACRASVVTGDVGAVCDASWVNGTAVITASDDPDNDLPQALSAINAMTEASGSYGRSADLRIFTGKTLKCGKSIGGLSNCCKDSGLLLDISLTSCNTDEKELAAQQKKKACHYVGTYCSNKSLFGCLMKKMTYCCYGSVLARIVEEAGHSQLGKSWGDAKTPQCSGFSVEEFQMIDLTNVDFSDFYADKLGTLAQNDPNSTVAAIAASIETMNARGSAVK